jgi:hypothetical protein
MQPIEIRPNRFAYLIPIPFVLFLMWIFYWFTIAEPNENFTGAVKIFLVVTVFVEAVGLFLTAYFFKQFLKPPVIFRMDDEGVVYNPAGVSTGLIRWEEISDVNEVNISQVVPNSQVNESALAIQLKNPEEFRKKYNIVLKKALQLGNKLYNADVLIERNYLKKHYEAVKAEMKRKVPLSFLANPVNARSPLDVF